MVTVSAGINTSVSGCIIVTTIHYLFPKVITKVRESFKDGVSHVRLSFVE
jgi:hypothetical protein